MSSSDQWEALATLLERISHSGIRSLTSEELLAFGRLYRRAAASLSLAKTSGLDPATVDYLNSLVARAYGRIYASDSRGLRTIPWFFSQELPVCFRRNFRYIALAFGIFLCGGILGYLLTGLRPDLAETILGPGMSDFLDRYANQFRGKEGIIPSELRPIFSSFIVINNIRACVIAFASGIFAGLGTVYILFTNGLMIGIVSGGVQVRGVGESFWAFVLPHGVIELTSVFMAAGAGLMLGLALLSPGDLPRRDALKAAGREAFRLVLGTAALLCLAALIEAFFSPSAAPNGLKFGFAGVMAMTVALYFWAAGRAPARTS